MSELRKELYDQLKVKRPNLSASSLKTYTSLLVSIYNKLNGEGGMDFFKEHGKIVDHIESMEKPQTKKTALSSLFVLTGIKEYQEHMMNNIKVVNDVYKTQKHNPERMEKLKTYEEIVSIHNEIKDRYKKNQTIDNLVELLISYLCSGVLGTDLPPRRVLDYSVMKLRNYDVKKDNYIKGNNMIFNQYKTKDRYGVQSIVIPKELMTLINKWKKINESDYLLLNEKGEPFTSGGLSKKVGRLFDGNTIDMLRSIFLSNYYSDLPPIAEMEKLASDMGHSINAQMSYYVKK
jgi:hypothetical protein